jgi:putative transcriptional regulator
VRTRVASRLLTRLRVARAVRDLSQGGLARSAGASRLTISSIETGRRCPSTVLALRLAHTLGEAVERVLPPEREANA